MSNTKGDKVVSAIIFAMGVLGVVAAILIYNRQTESDTVRFNMKLNELKGEQSRALSKEDFDLRIAEINESILDLKMKIAAVDSHMMEEIDKQVKPVAATTAKLKTEYDILQARHYGIENKLKGMKREINVNFGGKTGPIEVEVMPSKSRTQPKQKQPANGAMLKKSAAKANA